MCLSGFQELQQKCMSHRVVWLFKPELTLILAWKVAKSSRHATENKHIGEQDVHLLNASKTLSSPYPLVPPSKGSILLFSRFDAYLYPQQIENKS